MSACRGCGAPLPPSRGGPERKWCSDRCRKRQYAGRCADCGGVVNANGSAGYTGTPERCYPCATAVLAQRSRDRAYARARRMIDLRAGGLDNKLIAAAMGSTQGGVATALSQAKRHYGLDPGRSPYFARGSS